MIGQLGKGFRDEIVATGLVLLVSASGSYYLMHLSLDQGETAPILLLDKKILGSQDAETEATPVGATEQVITLAPVNPEEAGASAPLPNTSPSPTPNATPTPVEIAYGESQEFENDYFKISFSNPRLVVGSSRVFKVEVVIANKSVTDRGLHNRLHARIERDNEVIIEEAAMSNTEIKLIHKGEKLTFTASMSLVAETNITRIVYTPGEGTPKVYYEVGAE